MQGAKGCTASNECVICEPQTAPPEQKNVLRKIASGKLMNVSVYISSTCTNYIDGEHAEFSGVLSAKALKNVIVEGGKPAGVEIKAGDSATVKHVSSSGTISIQSKSVTANNLVFDGLYSGLIVHDVNNLVAAIDGVANDNGPCGGVINSRGGMTARNCNCSDIDGFSDHTFIVQQPLTNPNLELGLDDSCKKILDVSKEFGMFGKDYEIRVFHNGVFGSHHREYTLLESLLPYAAITLALLLVTLPIFHPSARKLLAVYSKGRSYAKFKSL